MGGVWPKYLIRAIAFKIQPPPVEDLSFVTPLKNLDFYEPPEEFQSENVEPWRIPDSSTGIFDNPEEFQGNFRQTPKNSGRNIQLTPKNSGWNL